MDEIPHDVYPAVSSSPDPPEPHQGRQQSQEEIEENKGQGQYEKGDINHLFPFQPCLEGHGIMYGRRENFGVRKASGGHRKTSPSGN
jgi:hypothetical protein